MASPVQSTTSPRTSTLASSRRWRRLIPLVFVTYSLAYLDRSNYSIGVAGGLKHDLNLSAGSAALLGALFFLGYLVFQLPAAAYAENRSASRLVFWCVLLWSVFASAQGVIGSLWLLMVDRFALGVVEAAIIPAMLIFLLHWFSRAERGRANTFLILGNPITVMWLSAVSGYLIAATNWRWMFILEGLPAVVWAFVFRALVADHPAEARWLDEAERADITARLAHEQADLQPVQGGSRAALTFRNVVVLALQYLLWSVGVYGFVFWLPSILKTAQHNGIGLVGVLSAVPYAFAAVAMLIVSRFSDRSGNRREFVWPFLLAATALFAGSTALGTSHYWMSYVLLILAGVCMYAPYGPYFALVPEFLPQKLAGPAMALINAAGAVGGFLGAYVVGWLQGGISNGAAYVFMAACLLISALLMLAVTARGRRGAASAGPLTRWCSGSASPSGPAGSMSGERQRSRATATLRTVMVLTERREVWSAGNVGGRRRHGVHGVQIHGVQILLVLVVFATLVAAVAQRIGVPAPSLLVAAGVLVGLIPSVPAVTIDPQIISLVVLPPLLYASGEELSWPELRRNWRPVAVLAVGLVLASAGAVGAVTVLITPIPVTLAFLLGAVLASTDPVAVTALGRRLSLPPRMQLLVQAESLFNDATSLILFRIAVAVAVAGGAVTVAGTAVAFAVLAGGGVLAGAVVAAVVALIRRRTEDSVVESVITVIAPYAAYVLAEGLDASGVTAVVVVGVILGVLAPRLSSPTTRLHAAAVQGTLVFVLESVVFGLIGLALPGLVRRLSAADQPWFVASLAVTTVLLLVRIAWVFPLAALRRRRVAGSRVQPSADSWRVPAVLSWAGTRGVVPLAAALSIPLTDAAGVAIPYRDLLQVVAATVIVISLVVHGFTLAPLVRWTGLAVPRDTEQAELARIRVHLANTALDYVEAHIDSAAVATVVAERVRRSLQTRAELVRESSTVDGLDGQYRALRRAVVAAQRTELDRLHDSGQASGAVRRRIERQLDLEDARYTDD
jgi:Na+/H+ antiporter